MKVQTGWHAYLPWREAFEPILDTRFYTMEWLDAEVASGRARCWSTDTAAIIATLRSYPTGAVEVHGLIAAGDLDGIRELVGDAEQWGLQEGAVVASIASRAGFVRAFAHMNYSLFQVELRKDLIGGPKLQ